METRMKKILAGLSAAATVALLAACLLPAGDGVRLDDDGNPIETTAVAPDTNLTMLYNTIFTKNGCTSCHGGSAPEGNLNLSSVALARTSLFDIVGTDTLPRLTNRLATEQPRFRVLKGQPDSSLLYQIVATDDPKGDYPRMPRFAPALSADKINLIRRWIALGASLK